jgi:RNA polymerase sigma factor (TIGR02999 family)
VSDLLAAWSKGDEGALSALLPRVYAELRLLARTHLRREREGHSFQSGDLVNEVYLRLVQQRSVSWEHRTHFFGVAAALMRRILVDHARRRLYRKRGGAVVFVPLDDAWLGTSARPRDLVALDEALRRLESIDPRKARVVELKYFGGCTVEEIAALLHLAPITVKRDWALARRWLYRAIATTPASGAPR